MRSRIAVAAATVAVCLTLPSMVAAAIPHELAWQGVALDSTNAPLAPGDYTFHFAIYSDDVGGDSLWGETQVIPVQNGVLNVLLGKLNPIPDSVFSGDLRFLQVQFGDQVPYVPRTRIVSVGYAYRTSSVDGAEGGTVTSALEIAEGVESPAFTVNPLAGVVLSEPLQAAGDLVQIDGNADGGQAHFSDEAGNGIVVIAPDPDGEGGIITITGDAAGTTGITLDGNSVGSLNPEFAIVGENGAISFNMNLSDDEAVSFPMNSISAPEIKDEPGIAVGAQAGILIEIRDTFTGVASATATFPSSGYALVFVESTFKAYEGNTWVEARLVSDGVVCAEWLWDPGDPDQFLDQAQSNIVVKQVSEGPVTYGLEVRASSGRLDVAQGRVTIAYFPTAYGNVDITEPVGLSEALDPAVQTDLPLSPELNLAQERDESIATNRDRIESEIADMEKRLAELRTELIRTWELLEEER